MVKKGAGKAPANQLPPPGHDFIVFANDDVKGHKGTGRGGNRGNKSGGDAAGASAAGPSTPDPLTQELGPPEPPKPTAKQLIGGQSWTGKLPVNLLSEHCQKQKWERPRYDSRRTPDGGYSFMVTLSKKNPKTQEITTLPPFKLPPSHVHLAVQPTSLEARHVAATFALFRVCSMKNLHMMLPPDHRSLWKEFEALKKQDVKEGKAWMYDADPFAALKERDASKAAAQKKREERDVAREKMASMSGASGLILQSKAASSSGRGFDPMRGWMRVPKIEMGSRTRATLEGLLRRDMVWNPHGVAMSADARAVILKEFKELGFRPSHIAEATDVCKDRGEALEWLLIHVPEDDIPRWALPESYTAGVSVGATDLRRDGAIKRLAQSGYSPDLCRKVYDAAGGDEAKAAEALQHILIDGGMADTSQESPQTVEPLDSESQWAHDELWNEEMTSLEAGFGDSYERLSETVCQIRITGVQNGAKSDVQTLVQFRRSSHYPSHQIVLHLVADLPAYMKLSIIKKALHYARECLADEEARIFFVVSWIQDHINEIIEDPGPLRDVSLVACTASEDTSSSSLTRRPVRAPRHPKPIDWSVNPKNKQEWTKRRSDPALRKMISQREKLPAWQVQDELIRAVNQNQITIISGETGSGKSTQSVQFVLDDLYSKGLGLSANIIVTQPRRISALGLADRVSDERCSRVGDEVGYSIRGESRTSRDTRITFVTTGVLLRRLQTSGGRTQDVVASLADVSHIVIDEVHERSLDTDFLLTILRDVLRVRHDLKLILMSATLDASTLKDYFVHDRPDATVGMVEIPGWTYPVQDYYLDEVMIATKFVKVQNAHDGAAGAATSDSDALRKAIQAMGSRVNFDLLAETVKMIDQDLSQRQKAGGVLVFLPGVAEINRVCSMLAGHAALHVLPLHASLETKEQRRVFAQPPHGKRKVVVASNVAETSITIDDILAVIDTGRVKETSFDAQNNMRRLQETWASRAACKQRRGRAGRTQAGKCYKLFTCALEQETMVERPDPEIRRVPLEQLCLAVRAMGHRDVAAFLARTPTPPESIAVSGALKLLRRMGALDGEELTALGQQLAVIPADLRCGKLMVFGAMFGCLDDCVTLAAILSTKSPFVSPPDKRDLAKEARRRFACGDGDLLTDRRAFQQWDRMVQDRLPRSEIRAWCDDNFLSAQNLADIASSRSQYFSALAEIGITPPPPRKASSNTSPVLLRALTASAFTPQIARIQFPDKKFATSVSGTVELDPEAKTIKHFSEDNGRVFVHPGSTLFDNQAFSGNAAFLSYFTMMATSKTFIRELTPFNAYSLLLFAGPIELDTLGRGLVIDGWLRLRGWARIGVLVSRLRSLIDRLIAVQMDDPARQLADHEIVRLMVKLIELDGMDA